MLLDERSLARCFGAVHPALLGLAERTEMGSERLGIRSYDSRLVCAMRQTELLIAADAPLRMEDPAERARVVAVPTPALLLAPHRLLAGAREMMKRSLATLHP
jgi:hypothetical protein